MPDWRPTWLNERLRIALRLAELVLAGASVEAGRGGVLSNAFLLDSGGSSSVDAYQMLAYCVAYGLTHGHLIYASGDRSPVRHIVRNAGIEIVCHALDLDADPGQSSCPGRRLGRRNRR